jgi:molybdopterin synthase sulfur carrier subunit
MSVLVRIPTPLRKYVNGETEVQAEGATLREVVASLRRQNEGFNSMLDESGELVGFVNVWVNEEDVRFLQQLDTPIKEGDEVSIVPAMSGG